jgi:hypothetical protein
MDKSLRLIQIVSKPWGAQELNKAIKKHYIQYILTIGCGDIGLRILTHIRYISLLNLTCANFSENGNNFETP